MLDKRFHRFLAEYGWLHNKRKLRCHPRFILMLDDVRMPDPQNYINALPNNSAIIVRSKSSELLKEKIKVIRDSLSLRKVHLLAATDVRTALSLDVDGVHLSEANVKQMGGAILTLNKRWIISAAAHSIVATRRAKKLGANLILVSPTFQTRSHSKTRVLGSIGYRRIAKHAPNHVCPLGGINEKSLRLLKGAPVNAFAGIDMHLEIKE